MNKGADRKRGLVRITRQVHVDLDVFFIQARVLLVDCMLGPCRPDVIAVTSAVGGEHVGTSFFPSFATGGTQEAAGRPRRRPGSPSKPKEAPKGADRKRGLSRISLEQH